MVIDLSDAVAIFDLVSRGLAGLAAGDCFDITGGDGRWVADRRDQARTDTGIFHNRQCVMGTWRLAIWYRFRRDA